MPLLGKPMQAIRRQGSYVRGRWVDGEETIIHFRGSVRPIKPDTERYEPEGRVVVSALVMYSTERLIIGEPGKNNRGDLVEWEGMRYEVVREYPWQNTIIPHWKYIIAYLESADEEQ